MPTWNESSRHSSPETQAETNQEPKKRFGRQKIDLIGRRFGRLIVISEAERHRNGDIAWLCQCDCGNRKAIRGADLRNNQTRSCGCYAKEQRTKRISKYAHNVWKPQTGATSYMVEKDGVTRSLKEWSEILDIRLSTLVTRWNRGWADHEILRPTVSQLEEKFAIPDPLIEPEDKLA